MKIEDMTAPSPRTWPDLWIKSSVEGFKQDLETLTGVDPEWMSPKTPILPSENEVVMSLLASCRYGQHQLCDPEGNLLDVFE